MSAGWAVTPGASGARWTRYDCAWGVFGIKGKCRDLTHYPFWITGQANHFLWLAAQEILEIITACIAMVFVDRHRKKIKNPRHADWRVRQELWRKIAKLRLAGQFLSDFPGDPYRLDILIHAHHDGWTCSDKLIGIFILYRVFKDKAGIGNFRNPGFNI